MTDATHPSRTGPRGPVRCVHLDLKGLPPTEARLLKLLEVFAAAGFDSMLVEWEDAFPWTVDPRFRTETAYSPEFVGHFHQRAAELELEIIPLVQCIGHMETPLAISDYAGLRERPDRCDCLNPLAAGARELVERMIDDVLAATDNVRRFHVGGDEAYWFGHHPDTRAYVECHGKAALYLRHVEPLLDRLLARGIRPMLWHDMMIDWPADLLARLGAKADLVVWGYQGRPATTSGHHRVDVMERFATSGVPMWGATAYKGADGPGDSDLPDVAARIENATGWFEVIERFALRGVIATGWSRYSTHRVQCDPTDGALDALIEVGSILSDGRTAGEAQVLRVLEKLGESERFIGCRDALRAFTRARREAWSAILLAHEQLAVHETDARRRGPGTLESATATARARVQSTRDAAAAVRRALAGSIPELWLNRYTMERLAPLEKGISTLTA